MPTVFTHPAVPIALAFGLGRKKVSGRLLCAGVVASAAPDLDVIAFSLGIPYAAELGHRGFSHSLLFAFALALLGASLFRWLHSTFRRSFWFLFIAAVSHGILDAFTNGGLGIAFLWPWSGERYFAPTRVIEVSPLGVSRFFSPKGVEVLRSECIWIWLPFMGLAIILAVLRRISLLFARGDKVR
ncbi:metal-dependent hydrolase [Methylomonas sp. SURF-2]|uniref:Metal-dependent hydrolase n=1 Tax=Methylomonas subterranea TaxID=2952225 RepID=A0ABT1TEX5_9GAMM|nr:metal-dependent hydrolase [Methylomonas sp. SURF-2]MCQ8104018.1 metal-dependent hydrolase [Methylomonas sp. SURF-2]